MSRYLETQSIHDIGTWTLRDCYGLAIKKATNLCLLIIPLDQCPRGSKAINCALRLSEGFELYSCTFPLRSKVCIYAVSRVSILGRRFQVLGRHRMLGSFGLGVVPLGLGDFHSATEGLVRAIASKARAATDVDATWKQHNRNSSSGSVAHKPWRSK